MLNFINNIFILKQNKAYFLQKKLIKNKQYI
jgi:hypothetical protein